jgi:uncharacterized protein YkwD
MVGRVAIAVLLLSSSAWASHEGRKVSVSTKVHSGPGTGYSVLGTAGAGQQYVVVSVSGSWLKIWWAGNTGWVASSATAVVSGTGAQVKYSSVSVRSGPSSTYASVGTAHYGEIYVVTGTSGSYTRIWFGGLERWIYSGYVSTHALSSGTSAPPPSSGAEKTYSNGHPLSTPTTNTAILSVENEIHRLVNQHRVSIGRNALTMHGGMRDCARAHSKHMAVHAFFAHVNPEGDDPFERMTKVGIRYGAAGENIAAGQSGAQAAFNAWMNSAGHRRNIENGVYTHTGIGYWYQSGSRYTRYYGQLFGANVSP